jgi:peptide/nickel transport system substrate-binding protein
MKIRNGGRRRRAVTGAAALALAGLLAVSACSGHSGVNAKSAGSGPAGGSAGGWETGNVQFVHAGLAPAHIDPAQVTDLDSFTVSRNMYDPLVWTDSSGKIIPWLATKWTTSPDGLSTTFTLRQGVTFTDGTTFSSADVKESIERMIAMKAGQAGSLLASVTGVTTPNAQTAVIHTKTPAAYLLTHLTKVGMVSAAGVAAHRTASDPYAAAWYDSHSDGTGPYRLGTWNKATELTLIKNKDWWKGWQPGSIDTVVDKFVSDYATRVQMVERGDAGTTEEWTVPDAERVGAQGGFTLQKYSTYDIDPIITLNTQKPPFNNKLVRQAAQYAFDYSAMVSYWKGQATVPGGPMPDNFPGAAQFPAYAQNLAKAKSLIARSGLNLSANPVTITVIAGVQEFSVEATVFQQALDQAGFTVKIQTLPGAQALAVLGKPQQAANATTLISSPFTADPTLFLGNFYLPDGSFNFSFYNNPTVTSLIGKARSSSDTATAQHYVQQAETIIRDDAPAIWTAVPKTLVAVPDYVTGYSLASDDFRWTMYFWPIQIKAH